MTWIKARTRAALYPVAMTSTWLPRIDASHCTGCGDCIDRCPVGALSLLDGKATLAVPQACTYCAECEVVCPTGAIELPLLVCFADPMVPLST